MRSLLIVGGDKEARRKKARRLAEGVHPIDQIILSPHPSITIEDIRNLKENLFLKPIRSKKRVAFIFEGEKMTIFAQNALLKTLEEPPERGMIILTAQNPDSLLPTILSRCHIIRIKEGLLLPKDLEKSLKELERLLKSGVGERLQNPPQIGKKRKEAGEWLKRQVVLWHCILLYQNNCINYLPKKIYPILERLASNLTSKQVRKTIEEIEKVYQMILTNVNIRLALDNLLLSYPSL